MYKFHQSLLTQDTAPHNVFILLKGLVKVAHTISLGQAFTLGVFERGEVFGDVEAIMQMPYFSSVETITSCTCSLPDLFHTTTPPWFSFKGIEHAYQVAAEAIPKLTFGRLEWKDKQVILPVSVRAHHALVDGYHIHLVLEQMKASIATIGSQVQSQPLYPVEKLQQLHRLLKRHIKQLYE